jgi:hypothetical protein
MKPVPLEKMYCGVIAASQRSQPNINRGARDRWVFTPDHGSSLVMVRQTFVKIGRHQVGKVSFSDALSDCVRRAEQAKSDLC